MLAVALMKYAPAGVPDRAFLKVTPSNTPAGYVAGGDTLNLTPSTWSDPNGLGLIGLLNPPAVNPSVFSIVGMTGVGLGATAQVVPGLTLATYKLQIFPSGGNQGNELGAGNYAAGILAGYFVVEVEL